MKRLWLLLTLLLTPPVMADIYVLVPQSSALESISESELTDLYMGRKKAMHRHKVVILERGEEDREVLFSHLTSLTLSQVNAYWAKLRFSGRVMAPVVVESNEELLRQLKANPNMLSYSRSIPDDEGVRVILTIKDDE